MCLSPEIVFIHQSLRPSQIEKLCHYHTAGRLSVCQNIQLIYFSPHKLLDWIWKGLRSTVHILCLLMRCLTWRVHSEIHLDIIKRVSLNINCTQWVFPLKIRVHIVNSAALLLSCYRIFLWNIHCKIIHGDIFWPIRQC